jgi:hypothetical protein
MLNKWRQARRLSDAVWPGANPAAINGKYLFGLDCLVLKKL